MTGILLELPERRAHGAETLLGIVLGPREGSEGAALVAPPGDGEVREQGEHLAARRRDRGAAPLQEGCSEEVEARLDIWLVRDVDHYLPSSLQRQARSTSR